MKISCIIIIVAFACLKSLGQTDIPDKQGFIITSTGDTVNGFIKNYPIHYLAKEVIFKGEVETFFTCYRPNEIRGYSIDNIQFASYKSLELIHRKKRREIRIDSVITWRFLRKVVEGDLNLYALNETSEASIFFVKSGENGFTELSREITYADSKKITNDKFKFDLGKLMNNSPDMTEQILKTDFNEKSLAETVDTYNRMRGKSIKTFYTHLKKVDFSLNIELDKYLNEYRYPTWGYGAGVESHLYKPTKSLDFEFSYGLYYNMYSYDGEMNVFDPVYGNVNTAYTKSADIFNLPIYLSFNNKDKLFSAIGELGINPYIIKEKDTYPDEVIEGKWTYNFNLMANIGFSVNTKKNISIKYIVHMSPFFLNSLKISYRFKQ